MKTSLGTVNMGPNTELMVHERSARAIAFGHGLIDFETEFGRAHKFPHTFRLGDGSLPELVERVLHTAGAAEEFEAFRAEFIRQYPLTTVLEYFEDCAALVNFANSRAAGIPEYLWWPMPGGL